MMEPLLQDHLVSDPRASLVIANRVIQTNEDLRWNFGKKRSTWFFLANRHFKRIKDLGVLSSVDLAPLEVYFDRWREDYAEKYIHLAKAADHIFIKQYSRFDSDYRLLLKQKLRMLNLIQWDLKIELTIDPKKTMRYSDGFSLLNKGWNRLLSWLRRRYGVEFLHFHVLEIQKSGRPHLHVLLSGIHWIDHPELSDIWSSYGCGEIVYLKSIDSETNIKMSSYVLKYVNKTLNSSDKTFSAVLFASNKRLFSMSKGCQTMVNVGKNPKQNQDYKFQGSVHHSHLAEYCDEKAVQISPFMRIRVENEDFYRFPELFNTKTDGYTWIPKLEGVLDG